MRSVLTLIVATAAFWALSAIPARLILGGEWTYVYSGTAMLMCLVPGALTLLWANHAASKDPQQLALTWLAGTGVRLFGVLLLALVLFQLVPLYREESGFLLWMVVFYFFTLAAEMHLLLSGRPRVDEAV